MKNFQNGFSINSVEATTEEKNEIIRVKTEIVSTESSYEGDEILDTYVEIQDRLISAQKITVNYGGQTKVFFQCFFAEVDTIQALFSVEKFEEVCWSAELLELKDGIITTFQSLGDGLLGFHSTQKVN